MTNVELRAIIKDGNEVYMTTIEGKMALVFMVNENNESEEGVLVGEIGEQTGENMVSLIISVDAWLKMKCKQVGVPLQLIKMAAEIKQVRKI